MHMLKFISLRCLFWILCYEDMSKCDYAGTKCFQKRNKNVIVFVRTQKQIKAVENGYCVFPP